MAHGNGEPWHGPGIFGEPHILVLHQSAERGRVRAERQLKFRGQESRRQLVYSLYSRQRGVPDSRAARAIIRALRIEKHQLHFTCTKALGYTYLILLTQLVQFPEDNMRLYIQALIWAFLAGLAAAEVCSKPEVTASAYVTDDVTILTQVAFTTQFSLKCSNGAKGISLYAEVDGRSLPAVRLSVDNKYQVSWTDDIKKARSGDYNVKLYDEESYSAIRKAIRNGDDPSSVKPLAVVVLNNPGVYNGPWINSEFLATLLAAFVSYAAFSAKSKLLA